MKIGEASPQPQSVVQAGFTADARRCVSVASDDAAFQTQRRNARRRKRKTMSLRGRFVRCVPATTHAESMDLTREATQDVTNVNQSCCEVVFVEPSSRNRGTTGQI